jgi:DNA-directed RNA polymerase specialized sigma24 family protein
MKNPKRGPKLGSRSDTPRNPEQVRRIVLLRDQQGLRFLEIAKALAPERVLTESAAHAAYKKWRAWVYKGTNSTTLI